MVEHEQSTAEAMRTTMNNMDRSSQEAFERISTFARAIKEIVTPLTLPGAVGLLEMLDCAAYEAMNDINSAAEEWDAHYIENDPPFPDRRTSRTTSLDTTKGVGND